MYYFFKTFFIIIVTFSINITTIKAQSDFCSTVNTSFKSGEILKFTVYYNMGAIWVNAGDAKFTTTATQYNQHPAYHVVGEGRTNKSYEWFYKVRDVYETYMDQATLLPYRFIRKVDEGGMKFTNDVSFNHAIGRATSLNGQYTIAKCTQDVLSAIYFARNIDYSKFRPGDKIPFTMFLDDQLHHIYIKYLGKEKITTKYGTFNALKIAPLLIKGTLFEGGEKMTVWVSDDANHIPLRVDSPILVGSVKIDMMGYSNLRSPLTALIKKH